MRREKLLHLAFVGTVVRRGCSHARDSPDGKTFGGTDKQRRCVALKTAVVRI
jgi:hypothetical protein